MNEAAEFGLKSGITVPLVTFDGVAGFSLSGERMDLPPDGRGLVALLATYAVARTLRLRDVGSSHINLSVRERDALQWAAEGKTEWEIGMILGVSEHTAEKFLRTARAKLGATNRTHAVAGRSGSA
jgi:LuxR family transcriptional regulator, quorum-sensing system regulator BjaR1